MKEEQGLDRGLDQVPEIIRALYVCELMGKDRFQLLRSQSHERGCGEDDQRAHNSHGKRSLHMLGNAKTDAAGDAQPFAQPGEAFAHDFGSLRGRSPAQALQHPPAADGSDGKTRHTA